jgi:hypothetical protein
MLMHYFSCSGGNGTDSTNSVLGHITQNLYFSIWCDLWVTYFIRVCPGFFMSMHYFSCSGGHGVISKKSMPGHITLNLCFASGGIYGSDSAFCCDKARKNDEALFFMVGGTGTDSTNSVLGHVMPNMCFSIRCDRRVT